MDRSRSPPYPHPLPSLPFSFLPEPLFYSVWKLNHEKRKQLVEQAETIRESQASLEASLRRESAAVSELARRDAEEARRVEQVRALLSASVSAPAPVSRGGSGNVESSAGAVGSSVAATALSDLAALEEAIAERAREVTSLKVS